MSDIKEWDKVRVTCGGQVEEGVVMSLPFRTWSKTCLYVKLPLRMPWLLSELQATEGVKIEVIPESLDIAPRLG